MRLFFFPILRQFIHLPKWKTEYHPIIIVFFKHIQEELYWFVGNGVAKTTSLWDFLTSHLSQRGWCHPSTLEGCLCLLLTHKPLFVLSLISADPVETFPINMTFVQHNLWHFPIMQQPLERVFSYPHVMTHGSFIARHPSPQIASSLHANGQVTKILLNIKVVIWRMFDSIISQNGSWPLIFKQKWSFITVFLEKCKINLFSNPEFYSRCFC